MYLISAISPDGELYYLVDNARFKVNGIISFLKHLTRYIKRNIILVWDGATVHFAKDVKDFLRTLRDKRLTLVKLPSNSPMLNPSEQVWAYLKCQSDLRNFAAKNFTELRPVVEEQLERLQKQPRRIRRMFAHPECGFY